MLAKGVAIYSCGYGFEHLILFNYCHLRATSADQILVIQYMGIVFTIISQNKRQFTLKFSKFCEPLTSFILCRLRVAKVR